MSIKDGSRIIVTVSIIIGILVIISFYLIIVVIDDSIARLLVLYHYRDQEAYIVRICSWVSAVRIYFDKCFTVTLIGRPFKYFSSTYTEKLLRL